ncbi:MAG: hypothetical protein ACR2ND_04540 [Solirubrobacteraceae bacterium]
MRRAGPRPRVVVIAIVVAAALGALLAILQGPADNRGARRDRGGGLSAAPTRTATP